MENNDLKILNLKHNNEEKTYNKLDGTGVKTVRIVANVLLILGVLLSFIGIMNILDTNGYHPERMYYGIFELFSGITCFVLSPICRCLATIAEAAKIYKDKNV